MIFMDVGKLKARELTPLICIKNVWNAITTYGFGAVKLTLRLQAEVIQ